MSQTTALVLPMIGMIFLTFGIMIWMLKLRYQAVFQDGINPNYFRLNRGAKLPDYLLKVTQHLDNLFETPILFYVAIILLVALKITDPFYVILSWLFFVSRLIHSFIHTGSNTLKYRKNSFIVSVLVLIILWLKISVDIVKL